MFKKVLILSASAGAGHLRAAEALKQAFINTNAAAEVRHVDTLEYTNKVFRNLYSRAYLDMVNRAPELLGWIYDHLDEPWKNERRRLALDRLNTRPFIKLLKEYKPDIAVCTHFLPAEIISWLKAKERISVPQAIVVTDMDLHAMWLCRHFEHYFVALDETKVHLEKLGFAANKISVTGIPIDPVFVEQKDKAEARRQLGLDSDRTTILMSAGGFGVGSVESLIQPLMGLRNRAQIIAICGRNEELRAKLESVGKSDLGQGVVELKVVGFTGEMDKYMAASDFLLGKPGGLTTAEALARGLVLIIVNPIPGQEERNSDHFLEEGVAIRCNNLPTLAYKVDRLLDDKARVAAMSENVRRFARPRAAYEIVDKLMSLQNQD